MLHSGFEFDLSEERQAIRDNNLANEADAVMDLVGACMLSPEERKRISEGAARMVTAIREDGNPGIMETFLAEYGLSTKEGVALMCLAEALLRVPDTLTIDALINDKITPANWGRHLGQSSSSLVNASTWALLLTGQVLKHDEEGSVFGLLRGVVRRLGEPVVRTAVAQAMKELGQQFVLGQSIEEAVNRSGDWAEKGYTYSYDMLGEAACTEKDARRYHLSYSNTISKLAASCTHENIQENPGISVKLSALHSRYEYAQRDKVLDELAPRCHSLALLAKSANMGFNIDAEEADRLDLSLDVIEKVLSDPSLAGWDGFGVVVQAYGPRAGYVLDWLYALAGNLDRKIMVRLVKGAYWDTEIKRAQEMGLSGYPVFSRKVNTDISYIANARKLLMMRDRIYPQFATHNAHTVEAVLHMARNTGVGEMNGFEFQRLHGMGEALHQHVISENQTRCRIYAPVGAHEDLLAYLVRRLLENGANSSFVNQIVDETVPAEKVGADPLDLLERQLGLIANPKISSPEAIFGPDRRAAQGWDLTDPLTMSALEEQREIYRRTKWKGRSAIAASVSEKGDERSIINPARPGDIVGAVEEATGIHVDAAISAALKSFTDWQKQPSEERAVCLERLADLYQQHAIELFAILGREAGKSLPDCVAELREAVDFCRYYANECRRLDQGNEKGVALGVFACISPWNFPLAIFTGQIVAALAAGNTVIAKPAEQTPLIAGRAVELMVEAGIPLGVIQLLPGDGPAVGGPLTADPRLAGVCFTGSTDVAKLINRTMADNLSPKAPLIAETGGLNAMIVDSSALPEQAVRDIVASSFQSAGQRCSALRMLYVQEDVKERTMSMLFGAMDALSVGDPWNLSCDVGPVIDKQARDEITAYCEKARSEGRLRKKLEIPNAVRDGFFVPPTVIEVAGINDLEKEIFGPVLHVASFRADQIDMVIADINATGYGLTFGLHTRVDHRVQQVVDNVRAGNLYVNRNQIGAVVGSQPFGGEGLSGTGPKAGGPAYLKRFVEFGNVVAEIETAGASKPGDPIAEGHLRTALSKLREKEISGPEAREEALRNWITSAFPEHLDQFEVLATQHEHLRGTPIDLPGPTGESNRLWHVPRGVILCLGHAAQADNGIAILQAAAAVLAGNSVLIADTNRSAFKSDGSLPIIWLGGSLNVDALTVLDGLGGVLAAGADDDLKPIRQALARRDGPILPLITNLAEGERLVVERALCIDTTAAGGNAALLATAVD
ncbi:MAG: bifunctional proline dehydrogenase/L-glutamate gamma-semialdehyde dehydrogenase PutA [Stappiaceae bacterium]